MAQAAPNFEGVSLARLGVGAGGPVEAQKKALDLALSEFDSAVKQAGSSSALAGDFEAAATASAKVKAVLAKGKALAESDEGYARYVGDAGAQFAIAKSRLRKHKKAFAALQATRSVDTAEQGLKAALEGASADEAKTSDIEEARKALKHLHDVLTKSAKLETKAPAYAKRASSARELAKKVLAQLDTRALGLAVAGQKTKVEAANKAATGRIDGLSESSKASDYSGAESAVASLKKVLEASVELGAKDRGFKSYLAGLIKAQPEMLAKIKQHRINAAEAAVKARLGELDASASATLFDAVDAQLTRLDKLATDDADFAKANLGHRRFLAALSKTVKAHRANLLKRRVALKVVGHEAQLQEAVAAVDTAVGELEGEPGSSKFSAVDTAIKGLKKVLESAKEITKQDRAYATKVAAQTRKLDGYRATLARRRIEVLTVGLDAQFDGLSESPTLDELKPLDQVLTAVEAAATEGKKVAKSDRALARTLAGVQSSLRKRRAQLDQAKLDAEIRPHRAQMDAAIEALSKALIVLEGEPKPADFERAETEKTALDKALATGADLAKRSRRYAAFIKGVQGKLTGQAKTIASLRAAYKVAGHRAKVEAAKGVADEAIEALVGQSEHKLYVAAEAAVAALKREVEAGAELGASDRTHAAYLAGLLKAHPDQRATIRQHRIGTAESQLKAKLEALQGAAKASAFREAESALKRLTTVTESNRGYADKHKGYARFVASVDARAKAYTKTIAQRRSDSAVAAHAAKVEAVMETASAAIEALEGEPAASAFGAAETAVKAAQREVEAGEAVAKTSRSHAALLATSTKSLKGYDATIVRRRVEVEVAGKRALIEGQAAEVETSFEALSGEPNPSTFKHATDAVDAFEKAIKDSKSTAQKDKAYAGFVAKSNRQVQTHRATIARRRIEVAQAAAEASLEGLGDAAETGVITEAITIVGGLETALLQAQAYKSDRSLARVITVSSRNVKAYRSTLDAKALEAEIRPHRAKLDAALAEVEAKLEAIAESPKPSDFSAAESAVQTLSTVVEAGATFGSKSKAYAKRLALVKKAIPAHNKRITARRSAVVIAAFKASVQEAEAEADTQLEAMQSEPSPASFKLFEEAADTWQRTVKTGEKMAQKDRGVAKFVAESMKKLAGQRGQLEKRRAALKLDAHRAKVQGAEAQVMERLEALGETAKHSDYQAAETAIAELMKTVEAAQEVTGADRKFNAQLTALTKKKAGLRALIRERRIQVAERAAVASIEGLAGEPSAEAFRDADRAVKRLETVTDGNASYGDKYKPFASFVGKVKKRILAHRATIDQARIDTRVNAHRAKVEAKQSAVQERLQALESEPGPAAFAAAELAVKTLAETVEPDDEASTKKHKAYLAGFPKRLKGYRRAIAAQRVALEVQGHRSRVEEAEAAASTSLEALDADAPAEAAFGSASDALDKLQETVDVGAKTAAKDKAHKKFLASVSRSVAAKRKGLNKRKVVVATEKLDARLEALQAEPSPSDFDSADAELSALEAALGTRTKKTKAHRATIDRLRLEAKVAPHRAEVAAATEKLQALLEALAEQTKPSDFQAATEAVGALEGLLEKGDALALESKAYGKFLSANKKALPRYTKKIDARRVAVVLAAWSATVEEAKADVEEKIEGLEGEGVSAGAFELAAQAITDLQDVLGQSEKLAAKSKSVAKQVALHSKSLRSYRAQLNRRRAQIKIAAHKEQVAEAKQAVDSALQALTEDAKHEDYQAAESAIFALKTVLEAGDELSSGDPKYGKRMAALHAQRISMRAMVRQRRVEAAEAKAKGKIEGLEGDVSEGDYAAAYQAVARLESVVQSNLSFGKRDKKYAKFSAAMLARVPRYRASIDLRRIAIVRADLDAKLEALDESPGADAFSAAESALSKYEDIVSARLQSGGGKAVKKLSAHLPAIRGRIETRRLESVRDGAIAAVQALAEEPEDGAFSGAERAVDRLDRAVIEAGRIAAPKSKLKKLVAATTKKATKLRTQIKRERVGILVRPHRAKVKAALVKAQEALDAVGESADAETLSKAETAIEDLEVDIGRGSGLRKKSKAHAKFLAISNKKVAKFSRRLKIRRAQIQIEAHRAEVEEAISTAEEAVSGLEDAERPDFEGVDKVIEALVEKVDEGDDLGSANKKYRKYLASARRRAPRWRASIASQRVAQVVAVMKDRMAAIHDAPSASTFEAAHASVRAVADVLRDNGSAIKANKKLKAKAGKLRKSFAGRHVRIEVARVAAARGVVSTLMKELGASPEDEAISDAEEAIENLERVLRNAKKNKKLAKSKGFKKANRASKKSIKKNRGRIARAKAGTVLRPYREALAQSRSAASAQMADLGEAPDADTLADADAAVAALVAAVKGGLPHAGRSKKFKKALSKQRKLALKYIKTLNRVRVHEKVQAHKEKVVAAREGVDELIEGLGASSAHRDYQDAMLAVSAFGKVIQQGESLGERNKKYRKFLAGMEKRRNAYPRKIRQRRIQAALSLAKNRVEDLGSSPEAEDVAEAQQAIDRVQTVMDSNASGGGKKFKKFVASTRRSIWKLQLQAGQAVVSAALVALSDSGGAAEFEAAEEAVRDQYRLIKAGKKIAKRSKKLKKVLAKAKKRARASRGQIQYRRLDAALAVAAEGVDALKEDTSSSTVYDAEHAVEALDVQIKKAKRSAKKNKKLKKLRKTSKRRSKAYKKAIKRARAGKSTRVKRRRKSKGRRKRRKRRS